jgi:hypothetical protein
LVPLLLMWTEISMVSPSAEQVIRPAGETHPLVLAINSPTHQIAGLRISEIIALADEAAAISSDFDVVSLEGEGCRDRSRTNELFSCLSEAALMLSEEPRYLAVLSIRRVDGGDRVVTSLIDLEEVKKRAGDPELEDLIVDYATPATSEPAIVESSEKLRAYLSELFEVTFREPFERSGHWRPFGTIEVVTEVADAAIRLDDREVGKSIAGITRLTAIAPGRRTIALVRPDLSKYEQVVDVRPGETAKVDAVLARLPDPTVVYTRIALTWLGAAVSAAGAGILIYAIAKPKSYAACVELQQDACPGSNELARFGSTEDDWFASPNGRGAPIASLGYSLLGMGATWTISNLIFDDDQRMPWIELAAGIAVFGASFGLSYAFDGRNAVDVGR